jgi:diguanylate cyclase (GGDEF)-like protein
MRERSLEITESGDCEDEIATAGCASSMAVDGECARDERLANERKRLQETQAELASAVSVLKAGFENLRHGLMVVDDNWRISMFNDRISEIVGYPPGVICLGRTMYELVCATAELGLYPSDTQERAWARWSGRLEKNISGHHFTSLTDGRVMQVNYSPYGKHGWIISYEDVSARVNAEKALAEQIERFDVALTNIPHAVAMFGANDDLILCNPSYVSLLRLPPDLATGGTPLKLILEHIQRIGSAPIRMSDYFNFYAEAKASKGTRSARLELTDGRIVQIAHSPLSSGGFLGTLEDVTQTARAEEQIRYMGSHDGLTGLPNRSLLRDRMSEALARVRRGGMFCIHYLDVDNFKTVNDTHGHAMGDLLLKRVTERLQHCLRDVDTLARLGGDEFVALQADLEKPEQAGELARRFVEALNEPFDLEGREVYLGVSVGIAICPSDGDDMDALLRSADMAMYRAKSEGRNTHRFFEIAMDARLQQRRELELTLRQALANGEFELYYQLQVDAQTEAITACEALLRWNHPTRGIVSPAEFIPVAEEIGLIAPLGAWVIRQACRDAATWPRHIGVAVNLSPVQFKGLSLIQTVVSALNESGLSALRLELEITESALLADSESTIATLNHLRALGVRIALDDFGTGYSSLSYLRSFPFDKIKIDRSFIKDLGEENDCSAIVRAVASLGIALGMTTTAEGVETAEQLRQVRAQGCIEVQGYYFGRPCPVGELCDLLKAREALVQRASSTDWIGAPVLAAARRRAASRSIRRP